MNMRLGTFWEEKRLLISPEIVSRNAQTALSTVTTKGDTHINTGVKMWEDMWMTDTMGQNPWEANRFKKFPAFYGTRRFITPITRDHHHLSHINPVHARIPRLENPFQYYPPICFYTAWYTWTDYKTNAQIAKELKNNTDFGQNTGIQGKLDTTCK